MRRRTFPKRQSNGTRPSSVGRRSPSCRGSTRALRTFGGWSPPILPLAKPVRDVFVSFLREITPR
eukprot:898813-Pyramimonas_sp.AAC.1